MDEPRSRMRASNTSDIARSIVSSGGWRIGMAAAPPHADPRLCSYGESGNAKREAGMVTSTIVGALAVAVTTLSAGVAFAQTPSDPSAAKGPESVVLHFDLGSATIRAQDEAMLDQASRLYRDGNPIVMIVAGSADTVGSPERNLALSQQRADAVLRALTARGIPVGRFQLVAKGETELAVATGDEVPEERNRRVEITWR
jgi:outer membrane protein OmpA-like peptidoglycan-associated protein